MKKIICLFAGMAMALCSTVVSACNFWDTSSGSLTMTRALTMLDNAIGMPVGTVIGSAPLSLKMSLVISDCSGPLTLTYNKSMGAYNTVPTSVSGVGVRISTIGGGTAGLPSGYLPLRGTLSIKSSDTTWNLDSTGTFELVKTGPISAGTYTLPYNWTGIKIGAANSPFSMNFIQGEYTSAPSFVTKPGPTCTLATPSIQVPLGTVPSSSFSTVGSTSPKQSFNISLNCSGGYAGNTVSLYTTMTDQTNPANVSDTLSLTTTSTASGVGIQIFNGSDAIKYGPDSRIAGNLNQWFVTQAGVGTVNVPLSAAYVKTANTITAGSANAIATFTLSYQ